MNNCGEIIGYTASGKPIYKKAHYKKAAIGYSQADHADAAAAHMGKAEEAYHLNNGKLQDYHLDMYAAHLESSKIKCTDESSLASLHDLHIGKRIKILKKLKNPHVFTIY